MTINCKNGKPRFRFGKNENGSRKRFTFCGERVVEVASFTKRNGRLVKSHTRRIK